jgi:PRTRC genetic system protein B
MAITVSCNVGNASSELAAAILLYKNGKEINFVSVHGIEYINDDMSKPFIGAGQPASKAALSQLAQDLIPGLATKRTVFPANVLSHDFEHLAWFVPPAAKQLWFNKDELGGKVSAKVDLPGLVFFVGHQGWFVFAVNSKERPTADTPLYVSPFLNVWAGGKICTGNIDVPKMSSPTSYEAFEDAFFRSYFTHINIHGKDQLVKYPGGPYKLWKKLIDGSIKKFPIKALVPFGKTVGEFLENFNEGDSHAR